MVHIVEDSPMFHHYLSPSSNPSDVGEKQEDNKLSLVVFCCLISIPYIAQADIKDFPIDSQVNPPSHISLSYYGDFIERIDQPTVSLLTLL